jgi:sporulation protein YlmC with PRC-barrel domain
MHNHISRLPLAALALASALCMAGIASAQVAGGTTTVGVTVIESTQLAMGWSAKKGLLGKTVYNEAGLKVGKVEDLIISPDRNVSYIIVGAGGFVGIGRHDVAIPVSQIQDQSGKLVMAGATKDSIKSLPKFTYVNDTGRRDAFIAAADRDIAQGRAALVSLEKRAGAATTDTKARIDQNIDAVKADMAVAEARISDMKNATAARWKEFEADVGAATARLRKSVEKATG